MGDCVDIINLISTLLDSGNYKDALNVLKDDKRKERFSDYCWELVSTALGKINDDTIVIKPSVYGACEQLLFFIQEKCSAEDALLEFIERLELAKNDAQFGMVLPVLQLLLNRLAVKPLNKKRSLEWCMYSITNYVDKIKITDIQYSLEGEERKLMDNDPNVRRVSKVYTMLIPFYQPFLLEALARERHTKINAKEIIVDFLICLLGKPLIFIDIDPDANAQSEARQACQTIIKDLCKIERDVLKFLPYLEKKEKQRLRYVDSNDQMAPFEHSERMNMTRYAGYFYVTMSGHFEIPHSAIPQVYSTEYIIHSLLLAVNHLLKYKEYGPLSKALALYQALNKRLAANTSHELLSSSIHYDTCKRLVDVCVYCEYQKLRITAIGCIEAHVNKFDYKGRYALIKYFLESTNHSGMAGFAISLYKKALIEAFNEPVLNECFSGPQLNAMLKKMCLLPYGAESDLIELGDQIMTALNFLRFLILKDKDNVTGIRDMMSTIETEYLDVLLVAVKMSKAHYDLKLKDVIRENDENPVCLTIVGNVLDSIPTDKKKETLESALNAFHLIEGLVARLHECVKSQSVLRASRRVTPLSPVAVCNTAQRIIRSYSQIVSDQELKVPAAVPSQEHEEQHYEENVKNCILRNALEFVPKSGWSVESLSAGAKAAGYPTITHGLFPNGGGDLVHYFNIKCNEELVALMKGWPKEDLKDAKVPAKFVENAIVTRLIMIEPYKSTWAKAMAVQTIPTNVPNCLATLLSLVDDICYHSGDRSVDFNWYVRRVGLAGIYKTAELFYLTDNSEGNSATRNFVSSRIRDAQLVQMALNLNPVAAAPQTLSAAFVTAKNILGINPLK